MYNKIDIKINNNLLIIMDIEYIYEKKNSYNRNIINPQKLLRIRSILKITEPKVFNNKDNIVGILNKLSDRNKDNLLGQLLKFLSDSDNESEIINNIFVHVFENSLKQPKYIDIYMYILKSINDKFDITTLIREKTDEFILNMEKITKDIKNSESNNYDDICIIFKKKEYIIGYSIFISQLYNYNLIENIDNYIKQLIVLIRDCNSIDYRINLVDSLYHIIKTLNNISIEISDIKDLLNLEINNKSRFRILDILDLIKV